MILAATSLDSFVQLITVLIIFVFVLILTYFTTRWMAGIQKGRSFNKNLRIIETISVGNNKMISIVEAGTKYIVVSIGKDDVNYLTELKEEELKDLSFKDPQSMTQNTESFSAIMDKLKEKYSNRSRHEEIQGCILQSIICFCNCSPYGNNFIMHILS